MKLADELRRLNEAVEEDARQDCDCTDCDGEWCVWCLEHHGRKTCPFLRGLAKETRGVVGDRE